MTRRGFVAGSIRLAVAANLIPLDALAAPPRAARLARAERRALRAAVDVLIPADGPMPAASAVGVVEYIERLNAADASLQTLIVAGLRALDAHATSTLAGRFAALTRSQQTGVLAHVERADVPAGFFATLRDVAYEGYYTQPRIWKLLGYRFRTGSVRTAALEPFDEQRLERVRAMAPHFREV